MSDNGCLWYIDLGIRLVRGHYLLNISFIRLLIELYHITSPFYVIFEHKTCVCFATVEGTAIFKCPTFVSQDPLRRCFCVNAHRLATMSEDGIDGADLN